MASSKESREAEAIELELPFLFPDETPLTDVQDKIRKIINIKYYGVVYESEDIEELGGTTYLVFISVLGERIKKPEDELTRQELEAWDLARAHLIED